MKNNTNTNHTHNNWLKNNQHPVLNKINEKGGALAITQSGELLYRLSSTESFTASKSYKAISKSFSSFIGEEVEIIDYKPKKLSNDEPDLEDNNLPIEAQDLKLVVKREFNPQANEEFIDNGNGLYILNNYKPTPLMELECNGSYILPSNSTIIALIHHLCNYYQDRTQWVLNWLAFFVQESKKSQTALVLRGDQGAGKGIFFNEVIAPLVGKEYTKIINDKSLNQKYLGGLVEDVLFFNLDEISVQKSQNASVKNFLKALVTNETITAEKKYKTTKKETRIYGQVLITSNEPEVLEIEPSDRRYTVYSTAGNLKYTNYLGYGNYEALSKAIKGELESFMCYLKCYKVDKKAANTAQMTPEKQELIDIYTQKKEQENMKRQPKLTKQQRDIQEFGLAIRNRNHSYFLNMKFDAPDLYNEVMIDLYNGILKFQTY